MFITLTGAERERFKCQIYIIQGLKCLKCLKKYGLIYFTRFFSTHLGSHFWKSLKADCKETGGVISSDPPCKDGITRLTMVPLNTLSELGTFEWWISGLRLDPRFFNL